MNIKIILLGLFTLSFVQCTTHTTDTTIGYKFSNQETLVFEDIDYPEIPVSYTHLTLPTTPYV